MLRLRAHAVAGDDGGCRLSAGQPGCCNRHAAGSSRPDQEAPTPESRCLDHFGSPQALIPGATIGAAGDRAMTPRRRLGDPRGERIANAKALPYVSSNRSYRLMATHITATAADAGSRDAAIAEIKALLGDRLTTAKAVREQHGRDESYHAPAPPDAVAFARSTEEVSAIVTICARHKVPIIAYG